MFLAVLRAELEDVKEKSFGPAPKLRKFPLMFSPRSWRILHPPLQTGPSIASGNGQGAEAGEVCAKVWTSLRAGIPTFFLLILVSIGKPIIPMETQFPSLNNVIPRSDFLGFQLCNCLLVIVFIHSFIHLSIHSFIHPSHTLLTTQHC